MREVDQRLGLTADLATTLADARGQSYIRYTQTELLRQHLYGLALGYARQDDQDVLPHDVALKPAVWDRPGRHVVHERLVDRVSSRAQRRAWNEALPVWVGRHQRAAGIVYAASSIGVGMPGVMNKELEEAFGVTMSTIYKRAWAVREILGL